MQVQMLAREGAFAPSVTPPSPSPSPSPRSHPSSSPSLKPASSTSTALPAHVLRPNLPPDGPISLIISTIRTSGLRGLWLGQMGTLLRETGGSSAWFTTYEVASKHFISRRQRKYDDASDNHPKRLTRKDLATYELMGSGALAGMSYNLVLFPADSVKSAVQTWAELHPSLPRLGFWAMARRIWRTRGLRGMYAGCGLTVARSAPSSAMIFWIYETMEKHFAGAFG